jgi:LAS superfamily LD-carboxypeptidase LdcB
MKKIIFTLTSIIIVIVFIWITFFNLKEEKIVPILEQKGYNQTTIELINKLSDDTITFIEDYNFINNIDEILNHKYFIETNLERYLNYESDNLDTKITMINANRDYPFYQTIDQTDIDKDTLMLVNKYYNLGSSYEPDDLITIPNNGRRIRQVAYQPYLNMYNAAKIDGLDLFVTSGYRSYQTQQVLYNNYVKADGQAKADTYSARPGYSEHQTGLAIDFIIPGSTFNNFKYTEEFRWLKDNAHKYGFIMRYPLGKENITGYQYESWHYRYVGVDIAKYIYENDITYDEYYAYYIGGVK